VAETESRTIDLHSVQAVEARCADVYMRGRSNVAKRVLLQAAAFNLALILRSITKAGTPRGLTLNGSLT